MSRKRQHDKSLTARPPTGKRRGILPKPARAPAHVPAKEQLPPAPVRLPRSFLGPELAAGVGSNEEAPELSLKVLLKDPKVRDLGLRLWRQFSGAGATGERELNGAGLTFADLWKPGVTESVTTSSTAEEISRYRQTLEFRAKFLEALLEETLADLERVVHMNPEASFDPAAVPQPVPLDGSKGRAKGSGQGRKEV